ncbi:ArsR/SmtB family transcription factor [Nocardia crassostreae]|uniref:ArsR/SmtB family transcription factor n=1 Tax=Nocardia crassostreae TaxID=53428 RepID=UPI000A0745C0|nr:metalloregulator ArsR/SmtB family transcription factor [Nocardia crassostreae]
MFYAIPKNFGTSYSKTHRRSKRASAAGRKAALFDEIARVGKALGNGRCLQILDLLAQGERTVESIATATGTNLTTASANLQTLKSSGLVESRRDRTRQYYRLAGPDVAHLADLPTTHDIVAYCRGAFCVLAPDAIRIAEEAGRELKRLDEGMLEWSLAGLPVESSASSGG